MAWTTADLERRTEEVLVDAYNDHEQLGSFECVLDELLEEPVPCVVLGKPAALVNVQDPGHGLRLRATVRADGTSHQLDLFDVALTRDAAADLRLTVACYKRWASNL
jgi:hypothetical protein